MSGVAVAPASRRVLRVKVKPNARDARLLQQPDGSWLAHVKAAPVEGKANIALVALVAAHFGVPKSRVAIRSGASGRLKTIEIR